jgi:hypothetical protein
VPTLAGAAQQAAVFAHYGGPMCACCAATEDLTIDHVHGGGNAHRQELFGSSWHDSYRFYRWLIREGFPDGYQVMCRPCNISKADGPACRLWHGDPSKKRCTGPCGQVLDLDQFYLLGSHRPGARRPRCRGCSNAATVAARQNRAARGNTPGRSFAVV